MNIFRRRGAALAASAGILLIAGVGAAAWADDDLIDDSDVQINVDIVPLSGPGALAMTVAGTSVTLAEGTPVNTSRVFTGQLPTVTVTDTRDLADIDPGVWWAVTGSVEDLHNADNSATIDRQYLGWTPKLLSNTDNKVQEGDQIKPSIDGGTGLHSATVDDDFDLLVGAFDSQDASTEGSWSVGADLLLKVPASVTPGTYTTTMTLSLFE